MKAKAKTELLNVPTGQRFKIKNRIYEMIIPHYRTIGIKREKLDVWRLATRKIEKLPVKTLVTIY